MALSHKEGGFEEDDYKEDGLKGVALKRVLLLHILSAYDSCAHLNSSKADSFSPSCHI